MIAIGKFYGALLDKVDKILQAMGAKDPECRERAVFLLYNDPFKHAIEKVYGALLDKVDKILQAMGAKDPECRERAVCLLYNDPFKHAPYSNLVSNELSKDSKELIPAGDSKNAQRYFDYVQAARDGQEGKDCLNIYPKCNIQYIK
ncbi:DM4/DM12 family domain-containing protein [Phthorimaea operculella]|nr:DM4/DM12 family domain-containing protein [Phthorimaea operculella]